MERGVGDLAGILGGAAKVTERRPVWIAPGSC